MSFLFWEIGGEKGKGDSILRELSMFEKQNQKKKSALFSCLLSFPLPSKRQCKWCFTGFKSKDRNYVELGLLNYS